MNDEQTINNILLFLDRVSVTGRQEMGAYAACVNWLEEKKPQQAKSVKTKDDKK